MQTRTDQVIPVPVNIQPVFLTRMQYCISVFLGVGGANPVIGKFQAAPGFRSLLQLQVLLQHYDTAFTDMTSFSGLQCPPETLDIQNNSNMTSLSGLEGLTPADNLATVTVKGNPLLKTAAAFAALRGVLEGKVTVGL